MSKLSRLSRDFLNAFSLFSYQGNLGSFGDVLFQVSRNNVLTPTSLDIDYSSKVEEHSNLGEAPYSEFIHRNLRNISLNIKLVSTLADIPETIMKLTKICENGEHYPLILGGKPLSKNGFVLTSLKEGIKNTNRDGKEEVVELSLTLKEYIPRINRIIIQTSNKLTSTNSNTNNSAPKKNTQKNKKVLARKNKSKVYSPKKEERKWLMGLQEG